MKNPSSEMPGSPKYYRRNFSLSRPSGKNVYEFLIVARSGCDASIEIMGAFSNFHVWLSQAYVNDDPSADRLIMGTFCDFSKAIVSAEGFSKEIKKLKSVIEVEFIDTENRLFDKYFFPLVIMDRFRAIVMRVDPLLKVEERLMKNMGSGGAAIMFDEGKTYALETVENYKALLSNAEPDLLIQNIVDGLRSTGWGLFSFRKNEEGFYVRVEHPPKLESGEMAENRFIMGVIAGILESVYEGEWSVISSHYNKEEDALSCNLRNRLV
jgi:hypothetical protein